MRRRQGGGTKGPIGSLLLDIARADLTTGVTYPSARVTAMVEAVGLQPGDHWNAAALSLWVQEASDKAGWSRPPVHGATAQEIVAQLQASGRFIPKANLTVEQIKPGMICAAYRNDVLCVGVVDHNHPVTQVTFTIEGEAGDGQIHVAYRTRPLWLPTFVGCGIV